MPARIRLLLAVAIVALSALGGAAYAGRAAADTSVVTDRPVADLDLNGLMGSGDPDKRVIETAYEQVEHSYYEPVNPQLMVDGETKVQEASGPTSYEAQLAHVGEVLGGRATPLTGGADSVANMTVIDAIYAAAGRPAS